MAFMFLCCDLNEFVPWSDQQPLWQLKCVRERNNSKKESTTVTRREVEFALRGGIFNTWPHYGGWAASLLLWPFTLTVLVSENYMIFAGFTAYFLPWYPHWINEMHIPELCFLLHSPFSRHGSKLSVVINNIVKGMWVNDLKSIKSF